MLGRGHSRFADRVRERDEHAVRPRCVAGKRTGDSRRARRDALATREANVDRKFGGRGIRSSRWSSLGLLERRLVDPRDERAAISVALPYWVRFTIDGRVLAFTRRDNPGRDDRFRLGPGIGQRPEATQPR